MTPPRRLFWKLLALSCSVLLAGSCVWYRAGLLDRPPKVPPESEARADAAQPPPTITPGATTNPTAGLAPAPEPRPTVMGGTKSSFFDTFPKSKPAAVTGPSATPLGSGPVITWTPGGSGDKEPGK
jgi:hypothetical protein